MIEIERCKECGANLAMVGIRHRCIPRNTPEASGTARQAPSGAVFAVPPRNSVAASTLTKVAVQTLDIKRGRPRLGEKRAKPWIAAGMSKATYYRRQAEKKEPK